MNIDEARQTLNNYEDGVAPEEGTTAAEALARALKATLVVLDGINTYVVDEEEEEGDTLAGIIGDLENFGYVGHSDDDGYGFVAGRYSGRTNVVLWKKAAGYTVSLSVGKEPDDGVTPHPVLRNYPMMVSAVKTITHTQAQRFVDELQSHTEREILPFYNQDAWPAWCQKRADEIAFEGNFGE